MIQKRRTEMKPHSIQEIRGAVARGWCHDQNRHKEMDADLAEAISQEIRKMLNDPEKKN